MGDDSKGHRTGRFLGSLKDALAAASREDTEQVERRAAAARAAKAVQAEAAAEPLPLPAPTPVGDDDAATHKVTTDTDDTDAPMTMSAAEAAREARGGGTRVDGARSTERDKHVEFNTAPTTDVVKTAAAGGEAARTKMVRGKQKVKRGGFDSDPVVGWLVIVGGPGIGAYRPIFEGNNAIGRATDQRIPIDFGDDAISSEEQAFIRYDSSDRSFLFVPNLAKTNVVSVNDKRPTGAVELTQMDVIVMGRTQLVFVPFCGSEFDWSELAEA